MSKQWKIAAANLGLRMYTRLGGNFKDKAHFQPEQVFERIVIFSTSALGDLMFNTPAIRAVRERYPAANITLISSHKNKQLVATSRCFNQVIYWDHKAKDMLGVIRQLRQHRPQLAIILHSKSPYDVMVAITAGCQYVFKDAYGNKATGMEPWLCGVSRSTGGHLIQRKLDLVAQLGCQSDNTEMFIPVEFSPVAKAAGKISIGLQMGASETLRCWPVAQFIRLAKLLLAASPHHQIELIGSPKELSIERAFMAGLTAAEQLRVVSHIGKTTLPQLLAVMSNMQVLVTGDTGPLHLAIALKTPTVSLFVTANPQHTGPYQNSELHQVMYVPVDEQKLNAAQRQQPLSIITENEVFEKVTNALKISAPVG
ncbi:MULTISPECIES: glycosyltransferase family 9 protein [Serratia]|jgi:ADP-heptose:LPS heptosyltransferase|nr:glycosyltransferase family 9 protein [Serratia liquefaciens]MBV0842708.1 glycosyltransferase family 9 protein [Serratia liquefaciens]MCH4196211.1 glycosyltransferase family 9 protein [Serratia liquefaciens]MCH4231600.1 glycosyltransferase family 9 protein [Serratia liquefaciens]MCH4261491.1 glycosyltransferase family 9 protein [Serratia liquefaciens]MCI1214024.1 glycosyltransferase family 9 protein [Serratia liquefaciens]